jgi:hypothetical protein
MADTAFATDSKRSEVRSLFKDENGSDNYDRFKKLISVKKANESKPSLNICESKNLMFHYSKTDRYNEDKSLFLSKQSEDVLTKEDSNNLAFKLKIEELIKQLPVPLEKKNDERFKRIAMKKMKRESLPPNQSAKNNSFQENPHQKQFRIGII